MDKVTDKDLQRFADGHIGGPTTEVMAKEIIKLRAENARLRGELQWYADGSHIKAHPYAIRLLENLKLPGGCSVEIECGERAREALENVSKNSEKIDK